MSDCKYKLEVLNTNDFEEVATFLDKHYYTRDPLVSISTCSITIYLQFIPIYERYLRNLLPYMY